ncbi:M23 family metallopeptidase [Reinekea marinisedimentorum]|uniref:Murein DD-endopeptidase MepM/ murein hydrolase activator NlpD n=1 Tax=Reinekea marinisedimentorum TaxID=230495 RepID=A0A4R3HU46_9GAMM|nr:M23 family metallopeptidase [Reinekea marinisedimentorum]TCS36736.1 murein DD-endopeptidase MepM/ murein hydrolase activator NlpD [Reinekea marinisedimentorum]
MKLSAKLLLPVLLAAMHANALELTGEFTQGSLLRGKTEAGATVELNGEPIRVSPAGDFVIGFSRDAELAHELSVTQADGSTATETLNLTKRDYDIQYVNGIAREIMQPSAENVARAKKDAAMVWEARATDSERMDYLSDFIWPLRGPITGVYGSQRYYNGEPRTPHFGIDIAAAEGTEVVAPASGVVSLWVPDMFYSGGTLIIDHGFGVSSTFIHLSGALVEPGEQVSQGQSIARVGSTGRSTGPHLDWRINWFDVRLDPQTVVGDMN